MLGKCFGRAAVVQHCLLWGHFVGVPCSEKIAEIVLGTFQLLFLTAIEEFLAPASTHCLLIPILYIVWFSEAFLVGILFQNYGHFVWTGVC